MEVPQSNNPEDRLIYNIEKFLLDNNAYQFLHLFLRRITDKIKTGEILFVLAPVDAALDRLINASGKTIDQIRHSEKGLDILANHVSSTPLNLSNDGQPVYIAINGTTFGKQVDDLNLLNFTSFAQYGTLTIETIDKVILAPGQLDRLRSIDLQLTKQQQMTTNSYYDKLVPDIIRKIALELSPTEIIDNCLTSKKFNTVICKNEDFWHEKLRKDYPRQEVMIGGTWKKTYKSFASELFITGNARYTNLDVRDPIVKFAARLPKRIPHVAYVTAVATGMFHVALIASDQLYTFGFGADGQLGLGDLKEIHRPTKVTDLVSRYEVSDVACGDYHTAVISNRQLYTFGLGSYGQLGLENRKNQNTPTVTSLSNVARVVAAGNRTAVISSGKLYMLGNPLGSALYDKIVNLPVLIRDLDDVTCVSFYGSLTAIVARGVLRIYRGQFNENSFAGTPRLIVDNLPNITQVACGDTHVLIVANGQVYSWGSNSSGQLGVGDNNDRHFNPTLIPGLDNVTRVACGSYHSAVIAGGQLYTFGSNTDGSLGVPDNKVAIPGQGFGLLSVDRTNIPTLIEGFNNVSDVSCFITRTCIVGIATPGSAVNDTKEEYIEKMETQNRTFNPQGQLFI